MLLQKLLHLLDKVVSRKMAAVDTSVVIDDVVGDTAQPELPNDFPVEETGVEHHGQADGIAFHDALHLAAITIDKHRNNTQSAARSPL